MFQRVQAGPAGEDPQRAATHGGDNGGEHGLHDDGGDQLAAFQTDARSSADSRRRSSTDNAVVLPMPTKAMIKGNGQQRQHHHEHDVQYLGVVGAFLGAAAGVVAVIQGTQIAGGLLNLVR